MRHQALPSFFLKEEVVGGNVLENWQLCFYFNENLLDECR